MSEWIVEIGDGNPHIKRMKELVRCKDCRYWEELTPADDNGHYGKCGDADCYSPEWWFCADGERREVKE